MTIRLARGMGIPGLDPQQMQQLANSGMDPKMFAIPGVVCGIAIGAGLAAIGHQIGVAVENARLYEQAQESAVVEERSRLARDLHDAVTQTLFQVTVGLCCTPPSVPPARGGDERGGGRVAH